ncbi:MAG: tetratricopeptide repeat protein, partial [Planctomycetes bacterium]|nr:tetratricopeptide repeat protein [Planctomycetota bacterium]
MTFFVILATACWSRAGEPSSSLKVCVIRDRAPIGVSGQAKTFAHLGEIFRAEPRSERFFWIPKRRLWVSREDVLPLQEAYERFTSLLEQSPTAELFHARALVAAELGQNEAALDDFAAAIERAPKLVSAYINRGNLLRKLGQLDGALHDYDTAIRLEPNSAVAFHNRGILWAQKKNLDRAIADATRAIALDPQFADAYNNRGVYWRDKGRYQKALEDYSRAIELEPNLAAAYANRGYVFKELGQPKQALEDYRKALSLAPELAQAHNDLAWLRATCPEESYRSADEAVQHARRACELTDYRNAAYLDTLAASYAAAGDF